MGKGKICRARGKIIVGFCDVTVLTGLLFLSTKIVDNLWRTMLTIFKSDISASVLSKMPFFYTEHFLFVFSRLQSTSVKIGVCAVKLF